MTAPSWSPQPQPQPPKPKHSPSFWILIALGIAVVVVPLILLFACGAMITGAAIGSATESASSYTESPDAEDESSSPAAKKKSGPEATILDGTHEVGVDVKAGRYKTMVADGDYCYWERAKNDEGDLNSIIANDNVDGPARASVTIKKGEFFKTEDCGTWVKVS